MRKDAIGLVLSGGGVRGIAHVGAIKALEETNINITHVAGTSAGALVGAFFASGHDSESMMNFFRETSIFSLRNYAAHKPGLFDTENFLSLVAEMVHGDSFSNLQKKLFISTSDILNGDSKIFSSGPLLKPLLASAAFPGVFTPIEFNGSLFADGGILNNFPVEPLIPECQKIIGVFCNPLAKLKQEDITNSFRVLDRAYHMSMTQSSLPKFSACDLVISPQDLAKFPMFGMSHMDEIFEIGYVETKEKLKAHPAFVNSLR